MKNTEKTMEKLVALCKNRGFIYAGSEIYGGLANSWDYGPLGVELKNNVKKAWWKKFVQENPYNVGLDSRHPDEPAGLGGLRPRRPPSTTRSSTARPARCATGPTSSSRTG